MRDLDELGWHPRRRSPFGFLTGENVKAFEREFGVHLPDEYVAFSKNCNGGSLTAQYVNQNGQTKCEISDLFGMGSKEAANQYKQQNPQAWDYGNLWAELPVVSKLVGHTVVPIGCDGGGNYLFIETTESTPSVNRLIMSTRNIYRIASSFEALIEMLDTELLG